GSSPVRPTNDYGGVGAGNQEHPKYWWLGVSQVLYTSPSNEEILGSWGVGEDPSSETVSMVFPLDDVTASHTVGNDACRQRRWLGSRSWRTTSISSDMESSRTPVTPTMGRSPPAAGSRPKPSASG